ncbi:Exodeoxyribonuclease VII small subunit [Fodinibius salinus]|uniref:Exodeoxyribonuclease 7 small subunit n=1 Tax=Fodinibius salinus TaxID=860790 RepID=A0A5D3YMD2_9BACT|nr:exodeoxyribonuclease VII small subunit [Fodinibius salinus]TYP93847.1 Exodeoxyribonuclease VII small subunit [Fodinibius salinus]
MSNSERLSFEQALSKLEDVVNKLEDESISLDKSIDLYEKGIELSDFCTQTLENAELRIKKVAEKQANNNENE